MYLQANKNNATIRDSYQGSLSKINNTMPAKELPRKNLVGERVYYITLRRPQCLKSEASAIAVPANCVV
jgi:hypothetical protein